MNGIDPCLKKIDQWDSVVKSANISGIFTAFRNKLMDNCKIWKILVIHTFTHHCLLEVS